MAFARKTYVGSGSTGPYTFSFPYITADHIHVYVDGVEVGYTMSSPGEVTLDSAAATDTTILIQRETPVDVAEVDFEDGSTLAASDLDRNRDQNLYVVQEAKDGFTDALVVDESNTYDANGRRIVNLAPGQDADDAVTKEQLDTALISEGNVTAPGTGYAKKFLKAISASTWGWVQASLADLSEITGSIASHVTAFLNSASKQAAREAIGIVGWLLSTTTPFSLVDLDGDVWLVHNATHDGTDWHRVNESRYSLAVVWYRSSIPGEEELGLPAQGLIVWWARPSKVGGVNNPAFTAESPTTKIKSTFGAMGGWELGFGVTQFRDLVTGGNGIEIDGNGTVPYGRLCHVTISGVKWTGILRNPYLDQSATDRKNQPSLWAGFVGNVFKLLYAPAQDAGAGASEVGTAAPVWGSSLLEVDMASGKRHRFVIEGTPVEFATAAAGQDSGSVAHGLGGAITGVTAYMECITDQYGYVTGDRVMLHPGFLGYSGANSILGVAVPNGSTTNWRVYLSNGSPPTIVRLDTGAVGTVTAANWKIVVTPERRT